MATDTWMHAVTGIYMVCNGSRLFAYVPQITVLVKTRRADGISIGSWLIFAVAHASTAAYAFEMRSDAMLVWYGVANMALSLLVAALAESCARWNTRNRSAGRGAGVLQRGPRVRKRRPGTRRPRRCALRRRRGTRPA